MIVSDGLKGSMALVKKIVKKIIFLLVLLLVNFPSIVDRNKSPL